MSYNNKKSRRKKLKCNKSFHIKLKQKYNTCFYCGEKLEDEEKTIDHIKPLAKGGKDEEYNICIACEECNTNKGDFLLSEYVSLVLSGYDFYKNAEKNKRKKGFGFEGAIYNSKVVSIDKLVVRKSFLKSSPNSTSIEKRLNLYKKTGKFAKKTYVKEFNGMYVINQGYINYLICKKLNIKEMEVVIVYDNKERI